MQLISKYPYCLKPFSVSGNTMSAYMYITLYLLLYPIIGYIIVRLTTNKPIYSKTYCIGTYPYKCFDNSGTTYT